MHIAVAQPLRLLGMLASLSVIACGCSGEAALPEFAEHLVPVRGTVTMNGQPLSGATVIFHPADTHSRAVTSYGTTDGAGAYEMTTIAVGHGPQIGAVSGDYVVTISKIAMPDGSSVPSDMTDADAEAEGAKEIVPPRYSQPERSDLMVHVANGSDSHGFDL